MMEGCDPVKLTICSEIKSNEFRVNFDNISYSVKA